MIEELDGHRPASASAPSSAKDAAAHYRAIIGAFTETIRLSDFKANVAIVFSGIMMGPVISFKDKLPKFVPLAVALAPFLLVFLCLLICLYPRYVNEGRVRFIIARNAAPELFTGPDSEEIELEKLQTLCAILSRILYWKTLMLLISFYTAIFTVTAMALIVVFQAL
jgi:TctA family transporter